MYHSSNGSSSNENPPFISVFQDDHTFEKFYFMISLTFSVENTAALIHRLRIFKFVNVILEMIFKLTKI